MTTGLKARAGGHDPSDDDRIAVRAPTAARMLDVSVRQIHRWEAEGRIRGVRVGHKVKLYPVEGLRGLLATEAGE